MKKTFVLMCMAGAVTASVAACGKSDKEAQQTSQTAEVLETDSASEESADSGTQTEEESAGGREDYVELQDLDIEEYITLADYKSMKVSAVRPAVDDETVTQYIDSELLVGKITDRAVEEGDVADIDFVGKKDGVAFEGGTAAGYMLTIGSGGFIPGFEEGLVGVMPGETVDLNLTFPENYKKNPDLAGQEVVFSVKVNSIEGAAAYETVTPEEMKDLGLPYRKGGCRGARGGNVCGKRKERDRAAACRGEHRKVDTRVSDRGGSAELQPLHGVHRGDVRCGSGDFREHCGRFFDGGV